MKDNVFRTYTVQTGEKIEDSSRLWLETSASKLLKTREGVEVKAKVDFETGEVKFFVEPEDLQKLREAKEKIE